MKGAKLKERRSKIKTFFRDFKKFITKGNIFDLAVAVVIGNAFNAIISSMVKNVIMPLLSLATGGVSVVDWKWVITPANPETGVAENALNYGLFIQSIIDFIIIAFCIFLALRAIMSIKEHLNDLNKKIEDRKLTRKDRSEMKKLGLNPRNKEDISQYKEMLVLKLADGKKEEEAKKPPVETTHDLLKQIRDLLKEPQVINETNSEKTK